jgi:two-component sensor histidine kinase/tetratricopeptide (TPR) repeat protein
MRVNYLMLVCIFNFVLAFGQQSKIDSLKFLLANSKNSSDKLVTLNDLTRLLINFSKPEEGLKYFEMLSELASKENNIKLELKAYRYISESYMKLNDSIRAYKFAEKGLRISENGDSIKEYLKDINQLGRAYDYFKNSKRAKETYQTGIRKFQNTKSTQPPKVLIQIYFNLAQAYDDLGQTENQINTILKGTSLADKYNYYEGKNSGFYSLGWLYMNLGQFKKAELYFLKAFEDSIKFKSKTYTNRIYHALGINSSRAGYYHKALKYNEIALKKHKQTGDKLYQFDILNNTAVIYNHIGKPDSVEIYAKQALRIAEALNHKLAIAGAKQTLVKSYLKQKEYNKAENLLQDIAKDSLNLKVMSRISRADLFFLLSSLYEKKKDYKNSLKYQKRFQSINDSLLTEQRDSNIAEKENKYQAEKKEKELAEQKLATQKQELIAQKANTRNWLLTLGILAFAISAFFIWKRYKAEAKAKQIIINQKDEIELQKNLIETLHKELHHRMKNNLSFIDLFINLAKGRFEDKNYQTKLNELQNRIRSMFEVHKQLFKKDDVISVNAKNYIDTLIENVKEAYHKDNITIDNQIDTDEIMLAYTSFPIGLIINEFVTNSYKYAFDEGEAGVINVDLKSDHNQYKLSLKDNGKGLPTGFDINNLDSFGLETIQLLTKEYGGTFNLTGTNGVAMDITLPKTAA